MTTATHMTPPQQARRTANIALHVKLTEDEAALMRTLAEDRGGHMRRVVVDGMTALQEAERLEAMVSRLTSEVTQMDMRLAQVSSASETWKTACSSILQLLKDQAAKRALTPTELQIWTLAMGETLTPPKSAK